MTTTPSTGRKNLAAMILLVVAAVMFITLHFVPWVSHYEYSNEWVDYYFTEVWGYLWDFLTGMIGEIASGGFDEGPADLLVFAGIFLAAVLLIASPFVAGFAGRSRLMWWGLISLSGLLVISLTCVAGWIILTDVDESTRIGPGAWMFLSMPVVHFIGVLCIRRTVPRGASAVPKP